VWQGQRQVPWMVVSGAGEPSGQGRLRRGVHHSSTCAPTPTRTTPQTPPLPAHRRGTWPAMCHGASSYPIPLHAVHISTHTYTPRPTRTLRSTHEVLGHPGVDGPPHNPSLFMRAHFKPHPYLHPTQPRDTWPSALMIRTPPTPSHPHFIPTSALTHEVFGHPGVDGSGAVGHRVVLGHLGEQGGVVALCSTGGCNRVNAAVRTRWCFGPPRSEQGRVVHLCSREGCEQGLWL